jgi:hypothetical protein
MRYRQLSSSTDYRAGEYSSFNGHPEHLVLCTCLKLHTAGQQRGLRHYLESRIGCLYRAIASLRVVQGHNNGMGTLGI